MPEITNFYNVKIIHLNILLVSKFTKKMAKQFLNGKMFFDILNFKKQKILIKSKI